MITINLEDKQILEVLLSMTAYKYMLLQRICREKGEFSQSLSCYIAHLSILETIDKISSSADTKTLDDISRYNNNLWDDFEKNNGSERIEFLKDLETKIKMLTTQEIADILNGSPKVI